jgi:hypothetical protein
MISFHVKVLLCRTDRLFPTLTLLLWGFFLSKIFWVNDREICLFFDFVASNVTYRVVKFIN